MADIRRTTAPRTAVRRRLPGLLAVTLLGALLAGCGIRATEVPTDFGPAPSRVRCSPTAPDTSKQGARDLPVQVFLLCRSSLVAVDRAVRVPDGATDSERRVVVAQGLLDELSAQPSAAEKEAGYTTSVPGGTTVRGPRPDDPGDALRLSTAPGGLSLSALGQLVCTLSDPAAAEGDGSVLLGGPDEAPPRRYQCTDEVRARPGSAEPPSADIP